MIIALTIILSVFRIIAIPVEFEDNGFTCSSDEILATTTKAESYFNHQFIDKTFEITLAPTVKVSKSMSYYGANYSDRKDALLYEAVREACTLVAASTSFSPYDNDSDGIVDNVLLITAGMSEADGAGADFIWPQYGHLQDRGPTLRLGDVQINSYAVCTELAVNNGLEPKAAGIGIMCHELAHSFGLIDLYDTDEESSGGWSVGLEDTSLMDLGCKNDNGHTPPNMNALDLEMLGIGTCDTIKKGSYNLKPIDISKRYLKALTDNEGEFFLFECRSGKGWDAPIGKNGLVVYHIDQSGADAGYSDYYKISLTAWERWQNWQVNCRPDRMCAKIVCPFFPLAGFNSFGSNTNPAFRYHSGNASTLALTAITREIDGSVSFKVIEPLVVKNVSVFQDAAIIAWIKDPSLNARACSIIWTDGHNEYSKDLPSTANACTIEGLSPKTAYKATIKIEINENESYSVSSSFTTKVYRDGSFPYIFLDGLNRYSDGSFSEGEKLPLRVFNCNGIQDIVWYFNNVRINIGDDGYYTLKRSGILRVSITHTDGSTETIIKEISVK